MKAQALTIPNGLSVLRLLLVPAAAWLLSTGRHDSLSVMLLAAAGLTDWLDGFLARKLNQVTDLGKLLDPLADRVAIIAFVIALAARGAFPLWCIAVVVGRDALLLAALPRLRKHGKWSLPVTFTGKTATALLFAAFPLALLSLTNPGATYLRSATFALLLTGALVYWLAGVQYFRQLRHLSPLT